MQTRHRTVTRERPASGATKKNDPTGLESGTAFQIANSHPTPRDRSITWACADPQNPVDPEVFHPSEMGGLIEAQSICATCPARDLCAELGVKRKEWGVWGGLLLEAGKIRTEPRKPGRPNGNKAARDARETQASSDAETVAA